IALSCGNPPLKRRHSQVEEASARTEDRVKLEAGVGADTATPCLNLGNVDQTFRGDLQSHGVVRLRRAPPASGSNQALARTLGLNLGPTQVRCLQQRATRKPGLVGCVEQLRVVAPLVARAGELVRVVTPQYRNRVVNLTLTRASLDGGEASGTVVECLRNFQKVIELGASFLVRNTGRSNQGRVARTREPLRRGNRGALLVDDVVEGHVHNRLDGGGSGDSLRLTFRLTVTLVAFRLGAQGRELGGPTVPSGDLVGDRHGEELVKCLQVIDLLVGDSVRSHRGVEGVVLSLRGCRLRGQRGNGEVTQVGRDLEVHFAPLCREGVVYVGAALSSA